MGDLRKLKIFLNHSISSVILSPVPSFSKKKYKETFPIFLEKNFGFSFEYF